MSSAETDLCLTLPIPTVHISGAPGIMATDSVQMKTCSSASPLQYTEESPGMLVKRTDFQIPCQTTLSKWRAKPQSPAFPNKLCSGFPAHWPDNPSMKDFTH